MERTLRTLLVWFTGAGCAPGPGGGPAADTDTDTDSDTDTDTDADTDAPLDTDPPTTPCPATVAVGGGDVAWVALAESDPAVMVHGPQGGWHILWSAQVGGTAQTLQLRGTITDVLSGAVVSDVTYNALLTPLDACTGQSLGQYGYLDVSPLAVGALDTPPELLVGHSLLLSVEASDFAGVTASAAILVTAAPDPTDVD